MTFEELPYQRPDMEQLEKQFQKQRISFQSATSVEVQVKSWKDWNQFRISFESQASLATIRHTQNTDDPFYKEENDFMDQNYPQYEEWNSQMSKALLNSPYRKELEESLGSQMFRLAEMKAKTIHPNVLSDLAEENQLASEYTQLLASAQIDFQGGKRTLAQMTPFEESSERKIRQEALEARFQFFQSEGSNLDRIYHELVQIRHRIAGKLGFKNFIPLAYLRMGRWDYGPNEVAKFRKSVEELLVPMAEKLYQKQWERTGISDPKFWDRPFVFPSGNPKPQGDGAYLIKQGQTLYDHLSPETSEFFQFMQQHRLMDLDARKAKAGGGYCDMLPQFGMPFIFSNFNGTSHDIDVLTHECGHAFQVFNSRHLEWVDYLWPSYEACEIHSMSMEFFVWPELKLLLGEDADKYRFHHLESAIKFIPYGVSVDEFQHMVYANPNLTSEDRHSLWHRIEQKYLPSLDYGGIPHLEKGGFWQKQGHIYKTPFYYIDYTLAQTSALEYWIRMQDDREEAWQSYLHLCKQGGSQSYLELLSSAGLSSPFEMAPFSHIIQKVDQWFSTLDSKSF